MFRPIQFACLMLVLCTAHSAAAQSGWTGVDQAAPVYIEGIVRTTSWDAPRAELVVDVPADVTLPKGLESRTIPAQQSKIDSQALLSKTGLPPAARGAWTVELASVSRLEAWGLKAPIPVGQPIALVGYALPPPAKPRALRAEYIFIDGKVVPLRSNPK